MDLLQEFYEKVIVEGDSAYYPTFDELSVADKKKLRGSLSYSSFQLKIAVANLKTDLNNIISKIGLKLR